MGLYQWVGVSRHELAGHLQSSEFCYLISVLIAGREVSASDFYSSLALINGTPMGPTWEARCRLVLKITLESLPTACVPLASGCEGIVRY